MQDTQQDACAGEAALAGSSAVCTQSLGLLYVQLLNNRMRGVVWGGGEQLWDWNAWGRREELSREGKCRRRRPLTFRMGLTGGVGRGWRTGGELCCQDFVCQLVGS